MPRKEPTSKQIQRILQDVFKCAWEQKLQTMQCYCRVEGFEAGIRGGNLRRDPIDAKLKKHYELGYRVGHYLCTAAQSGEGW